jgi:hypothetical protein
MTAVIITSNSKWAAQANIKCNDRLAQKMHFIFLMRNVASSFLSQVNPIKEIQS